MPKIDCISTTLNEICLQFCNNVDECPADAECYYRLRIREIIEDICDDDTDKRVEFP